MVIIKIEGGLGNQMFQYALYLKIKNLGINVKVDCSELKDYMDQHGLDSIFNVFHIIPDEASSRELRLLKDNQRSILDTIRRKVFGFKKTYYYEKEEERGRYNGKILGWDNIYLDGYWQTYRYFDDIKNEVIDAFTFPNKINKKNDIMKNIIKGSVCPVSIHMRLGDYCFEKNLPIYGGICTIEYYKKAINYIYTKLNNPVFFIFSNDIDAARKELGDNPEFVYVDINDEKMGWCDMMLMTQCEHNIIANSSFSWWGGYLNNNPDKIVIAPEKWVNNRKMPDICCRDWIRL